MFCGFKNNNTKTEYMSNLVDYEDWQTTEFFFFNFVKEIWGPHASDRNMKLRRLTSLFWYPESEAVDAFMQNWCFE